VDLDEDFVIEDCRNRDVCQFEARTGMVFYQGLDFEGRVQEGARVGMGSIPTKPLPK
jgi:hypothetical protein